jgi:arsenate reductase-like glutaredoxin family protein
MTTNRFDKIKIDVKPFKGHPSICFQADKGNMESAIQMLPAVNIHYKNARPVQILENSIKKVRMNLAKQEGNTKVLMNSTELQAVIKQLKVLDKSINMISKDPVQELEQLKENISQLKTAFDALKSSLTAESPARKILEQHQAKINELSDRFFKTIANTPQSRDAMNYLHSAQKRDGSESLFYEDKISTLGTFLNYVSSEVVQSLAEILPLPEYENTAGTNLISLSENSLALQEAKDHIQYQGRLAYRKFVNTHTRIDLDITVPQGESQLILNEHLEGLNPEKTFQLLCAITEKEAHETGPINWFTLGKLPWKLVGGREAYLADFKKETNRFKQFLMYLQSFAIGLLSIALNSFVFLVNIIVATVLFTYDTVAGFLALVFAAPFIGIEKASKIAHTLSWFQNKERESQVDTLTENTQERELLKKILKQPAFNIFEKMANFIKDTYKSSKEKPQTTKPSLFEKLRECSSNCVTPIIILSPNAVYHQKTSAIGTQ